jgi:hypothetical protein
MRNIFWPFQLFQEPISDKTASENSTSGFDFDEHWFFFGVSFSVFSAGQLYIFRKVIHYQISFLIIWLSTLNHLHSHRIFAILSDVSAIFS